MRVISGVARGLKLQSLEGSDTRPTLDNVKEAIFSMLFDYCADANVLDLFAGSGSLGIEALSRGAAHADFADKSMAACRVIRANLEKSKLDKSADVFNKDAFSFLKSAKEKGSKYDLIFLDPPYALGLLNETLNLINEYDLLQKGGLVVCEFESGTNVNAENYMLLKDKRYGRVCVNILEALS